MKRKVQRTIRLEQLETRHLMAFGTPWPDARNLTLSFPEDDVAVGAWRNDMRLTLDQVTDRQVWQTEVARAFQTWAVETNISIGLKNDRNDSFGTVGLPVRDPRFGDFRIGAFPQSETVLANAVPFSSQSGTWAGDLLLNSDVDFVWNDWSSGTPQSASEVDLFSVLLHEAGNSLGIADNTNPSSVMFQSYNGPKGALTSVDREAVRSLYGVRSDAYEGQSNNTMGTAALIRRRTAAADVTSIRGSINSRNDADFYRYVPRTGQTEVSVRLESFGISFLKSSVEVLNSRGEKISDAKVDSIFENNMSIRVSSLDTLDQLFIKVASNSDDVFGMGEYKLVLDYRPESQQPPLYPPMQDDDDDVAWQHVDIDQLFQSAGLIDRENGKNDSISTAREMSVPQGFLDNTRYDALSSLQNPNDVDFWKFSTPATIEGRLHLTFTPLGSATQSSFSVDIVNAAGVSVKDKAVIRSDGSWSIELYQPAPSTTYFLSVKTNPIIQHSGINYLLSVNLATQPLNAEPLFSGSITGNASRDHYLSIHKTQLYHFDLLASGGTSDNGLQMTIIDLRTGLDVFVIATPNQVRRGDAVWLDEGHYMVRFTPRNRFGRPGRSISY
nr:matrixin family metalloprotease [Pirellula sp.]